MLESLKQFDLKYLWAKYLAIVITCLAVGYGVGFQNVKTTTITNTKEIKVVDEKLMKQEIDKAVATERSKWEKIIQANDIVIVERTTHPDGSTTEKTTIDKSTKTDEKKIEEKIVEKIVERVVVQEKIVIEEKVIEKKVVVEPVLPRFSLQVSAETEPKSIILPQQYTYEVEGGVRTLGNFWITGSYNIQKNFIGLGLRFEF